MQVIEVYRITRNKGQKKNEGKDATNYVNISYPETYEAVAIIVNYKSLQTMWETQIISLLNLMKIFHPIGKSFFSFTQHLKNIRQLPQDQK